MDFSFVTRKFQRSIAGLSLLAILASFAGFTGTAFAKTFSDVSSSYFAYDQIDSLSDDGIMTGYENGNFGPDDSLTREQAAKILVEAFVGSVDSSYDAGFSDVADGMWYTDYVNTAALYGITSGMGDGSKFGVGVTINRADFAKMVVSAAGLDSDGTMGSDMFNDVPSGSYYDTYVGTAWANSIVDGTSSSTYSPANNVTRGQAAKMTYNAMNPVYRGEGSGDDGTTGSANANVMVEVSDDTPAADTIPSGATSVELATFDVWAEGDDSQLESLTVHQYGISSVGAATTGSGATVYLYNGTQRLTNGTSVNSTTHESEFRNLNLDLPEGEKVSLTVRMDMGTWTSTGEIGFEIESADMVDAGDSSVEGDFPAMGEKFSVATTSVGAITVDKNGTVPNAQVGEDGATLAKFKLSASSSEGGYVKELGLYLSGSISTADVENFNLYVSGDDAEPIAQVDMVDDLDVIRFVIGEGEGVMEGNDDGYAIAKGASKSFYVTADFNTGRSDDTVKVYVDQNTDVRIVGDLYGYGMSVTRTGYDGDSCTSSSGDCTYQALEGGDITVTSNGPSANDIAVNADDVNFLNFTVTSVSDVTFDNFPVAFTASEGSDTDEGLLNDSDSDSANFTGVMIVDTDSGDTPFSSVDVSSFTTSLGGSTVITEKTSADDDSGDTDDNIAYYLWTDDWEVEAGAEYNMHVEADVKNDTDLAGMTVYATLPFGATYPTLKDVNNKTLMNSSVLVPTSSITGKTMTVQTAGLTFSLASTVQSDTFVKGTHDVRFACFSVQAGNAADVELDDLTLTGSFDENNDGTYSTSGSDNSVALSTVVGSLWLEDDEGNPVANSTSVTTSNTVIFQDMNLAFDASETKVLCAVGDVSPNAFQNGTVDKVAFGISSASSVSGTDEDGSTLASSQISGLSSAINVSTSAPSVILTISGGGTLTLDLGSSRHREDIVVAGADDVEIGQFKFSATDEDYLIDRLSLVNRFSSGALATTSTLASYDDDVTRVTISYKNEDGETLTKHGTLNRSNSAITLSEGDEIWVPKDGDATLTVYADLQTITGGADAGDFVDLNIGLSNFRATAQGSGETYDTSDMADTDADGTILDEELVINGFDDSSFIATVDYEMDATSADLSCGASVAVGESCAFNIDISDADPAVELPIGSFLCATDTSGTSCNSASMDIFMVTQWTDGTSFDTVTVQMVSANGDGVYDTSDNVLYAVPGYQYLSGAYQMVVYETKPTISLSSSSPTGIASLGSTATPFIFKVENDDNAGTEDMQIRTAQVNNATANTTDFTDSALNGTFTATDALSTVSTGGIGNTAYQRETSSGTNAAGIIYTFGSAANLSGYQGISYWCKMSTTNNTLTLTIDDSAGTDQTSVCTAPAAATWTFVDQSFVGVTSTDLDVISTLTWAVTDGTAENGATYDIDRIVLYYEKIAVDVTTNADIDTSTAGSADNLVAYLKEGSSTLATGYFYSSTQGSDASTGTITFYPEDGVDSLIEIASGASKTISLQIDTASLLEVEDEGTENNTATFSMDMGTSTDGTVTAGDFTWYDSNATVRWLGFVNNTTLNSNTLSY